MIIALDLHNLSVRADCVVRTGIQQVCFNLLAAQYRNRGELAKRGIKIIPIPYLPKSVAPEALTLSPYAFPDHVNNSPVVLRETARELGVSICDLWDVSDENEILNFSEEGFYQIVSQVDWYSVISVCELRHVGVRLKKLNPNLKFSFLLHDLVCLLLSEVTDGGHAHWFLSAVMNSMCDLGDIIFAVSRNSALDFHAFYANKMRKEGKIISILLPGDQNSLVKTERSILKEYGLEEKKYFISVGTIEPRKNLQFAVRGFIKFLTLFPEYRDYKFVIVGKSGWLGENESLQKAMQNFQSSFVVTGYAPSETLYTLVNYAQALVMPSRYEGFGLPISMAKMLNTAVITCNNSSLPEVADFAESTFVTLNSIDDMALAFKNALLDNYKKEQKITAEYSWDHFLFYFIEQFCDH